MSKKKLTDEQDEPRTLISESDTKSYAYEVRGGDIEIGTNARSLKTNSKRLRAGGNGSSLSVPEGVGLYGRVADGVSEAMVNLVPNLEMDPHPRRKHERPDDAAVRTGNSEITSETGSGLGAGNSSKAWVIADNTDPGVYRLQTVNVAETSGNWDPNIHVEIRILDEDNNVTERLEANLPQLPWDWPVPVAVPASFTAKAVVHNDSANSIGYRLSAAYTKEDL